MKKYIIALILFFVSLCGIAQVTNNAISFERNGRLSLGVLQNNTAATGVTLQSLVGQ